ncbi:hypothetical protein LJC59_00240 [Desulfovibrio sp. OttesenSCG-928-A18]|nr:hypothetical protein [Desulfovibrio sp. OttesenSCG-928-A18]
MGEKNTTDKKRHRGRPRIERDEKKASEVMAMSQYGLPQESMAAYLGMSVETLVGLYREEIDKGRAVANLMVGKTLFSKAVAGDITAAIFWAKTQMGWRETCKIDHASSDGSMSPITPIDLTKLTPIETIALAKIVFGKDKK